MENFIKLYSSEDFVEQILSGLPPKSLMRFKCACKLWCNLIKSPSFVAKHLSTSTRASSLPILFKRQVPLTDKDNNPKDDDEKKETENDDDDNVKILLSSLNICNEDDDDCLLSTLNVPLPAPLKVKCSWDLRIAGHCDGIICLKLFVGNVILCNPAMKEFKLLPKSFLLLPEEDFDLWSLDYELDCYTEYLGFGYDPKGKDYKVVRLVIYFESAYWFRAEVYTTDSTSWREIKTPEYNDRSDTPTNIVYECVDLPIYFKGKCYWLVLSGDYINACGHKFILSFDLGTELFQEMSIPKMQDESRTPTLGMWKEFLSLITFQEYCGVPSYDMWTMIDDLGDGKILWEKHLTIGHVEGAINPMLFWKSDQLLFFLFEKSDQLLVETNNDNGHIVLYNIRTHILKHLPIHLKDDVFDEQALVYVNSIVSINGGNILEDIDISAFYGSGKFYSCGRKPVDISAFYDNDNDQFKL